MGDLHGHPSIGPYRIERQLRRGGMGVVYLVRPSIDGPALALKMAVRGDPQSVARFQQEIQTTRSLDHPGIVRVIDQGEHEDRPWYVMELVGFVNLADVLAVRGPGTPDDLGGLIQGVLAGTLPSVPPDQRCGLPVATAVGLVRAVAEIVAYAHGRGMLHRDLKPANILLTDDGRPVLCDFGVAQDLSGGLRLTAADEVVGTLAYIAPEQWAGRDCDERADVYALGAVLHEALTGRPPPRRDHGCMPLPLHCDEDLRRILLNTLEPQPEHRLGSARRLAALLGHYQAGERVGARAPGLGRRLYYQMDQHPIALVVGLIALLAVLVGVGLYSSGSAGVQWSGPLVSFEARRPSAEPSRPALPETAPPLRLVACGPSWTMTGASPAAPAVQAVAAPAGDGVRIEAHVEADEGPAGDPALPAGGLFAGALRQPGDGLVLGWTSGQPGLAILELRGRRWWLGHWPAVGTAALELVRDRCQVWCNKELIFSGQLPLPPAGQWCGWFRRPGRVGPQPAKGRLHAAQLTEPLPEELSALLLAATGAPGAAEDAELQLDELIRRLPASRRAGLVLRRGCLLAGRPASAWLSQARALEGLGAEFSGRAEYYLQRLQDPRLPPADPARIALVREACARLTSSHELAVFTVGLLALAGDGPALLAPAMEVWPPGHPLRDWVQYEKLAQQQLRAAESRPVMDGLSRLGLGQSWWAGLARARLAELTLRCEPLEAYDLDGLRSAAGGDEDAFGPGSLWVTSLVLGGPEPPAELGPAAAQATALARASLAGRPGLPAPEAGREVLEAVRPPPPGLSELERTFPVLAGPALAEPQAVKLLAALLAAWPEHEGLAAWARHRLTLHPALAPLLGLGLLAGRSQVPERWLTRLAPDDAAVARAWFAEPGEVPTAWPQSGSPLAPLLVLLCLRRAQELGRPDEADRCWQWLDRLPVTTPERQVAQVLTGKDQR